MTSLTGDGVSVHVIEDVSKAEEDGGGERRAAPEQRVAEFLPRFAGVKVRAGPESGTHAARQSPNLIRAAAALDLTSIALHAHFPARKIQRAGGDADAVEESRVGSGPHLAMAPQGGRALVAVRRLSCWLERRSGSSPDHIFLVVRGDGRPCAP